MALGVLHAYNASWPCHDCSFTVAHIAFTCCVWIEKKQRRLPYTTSTDWFCVTEVDGVYCAVRTESLHKTDTFHF
jgi:hypothetical protein